MSTPAVASASVTALAGILLVLTVRWLSNILTVSMMKRKYLPGPPALPIIGNLLQMPAKDSWETYSKWGKTYGESIYVDVIGSPIVILNSYQACNDLLEKRSEIYSDRPLSLMCRKLMGWERGVTLASYGERWRRFRKMTAVSLRKEAVKQFWPTQESDVLRYLSSLLIAPDKFVENIRLASGHSLMKSIYGVDIQSSADPIVAIAEEAVDYALNALTPGNFLVDFLPILQYVPSWFPGAGWKKYAERGRILCDQMADIPFDQTLADMKSGSPFYPSFTSLNLEKDEDAELVKWSSATMYTAGTDTTVATIHNFFFSMVLHSDVQRRAQQEIDKVIGSDRLPTLSDRANLPYINAVMKEVMRWQLVMPLALPHRLMQDDIYNGYFISKGTTVIGNAWAISRDPQIYEDPETFNPDRFLPMFDSSISFGPRGPPLDPDRYAFGFGRRICAGINYADSMVFIIIAGVLATFNVKPFKNTQGEEVLPDFKFISSMVREPQQFQCIIESRSQAAKDLLDKTNT